MHKRRHHYVWQFYLKAFCHKPGFVFCLMDGEIKSLHTSNIGVEKDLYRLKELSKKEANIIKKMFADTGNPIKDEMNRRWVDLFNFVFSVKSRYDNESISPEIASEIDKLEHNLCEDLHMNIEVSGIKYIEALRNKDTSFWGNDESKAMFLLFLMVQYCRTKKIKDSIEKIDGQGHIDFGKAWNILVYIIASSVGMTIFSEKDEWQLIGFNNITDIPFITSDQPVINLFSRPSTEKPALLKKDEFELYYPITPEFSIIIKKNGKGFLGSYDMEKKNVEILNLKVKEQSNIQMYSNVDSYLEVLRLA